MEQYVRIAVCVKWVPMIARVRFDSDMKRIVREGVPSELNSYDVLAINKAVGLRDTHGGEITAISMGPPDARRGLVRCLAMGADHAIHLNDLAFAGSDTLATSRALALAVGRTPYDLILFGASSVDAETGQVGPEVAEFLGVPQVTYVSKLDVIDGGIRAERTLENGTETVSAPMPVAVSVIEGVAPDTGPSRDEISAAEQLEIWELTAAELASDASVFGVAGSPTWVSEIRHVESPRSGLLIESRTPSSAARELVALLSQRAGQVPDRSEEDAPTALDHIRGPGPQTWVIAERSGAQWRNVTYEMLAAAQPIADAVGGPVVAVALGDLEVRSMTDSLAWRGADIVAIGSTEELSDYSTSAYVAILAKAIIDHAPYAVLLPSTPNGRDLAARLAARLQLGLTGDVIGLEVDAQGRLVQLKPAFGGNILAPIYSNTSPNMATVGSGRFTPLRPNFARSPNIVELAAVLAPADGVRTLGFQSTPEDDAALLDEADAVICVGMGIGSAGKIRELDALSNALHAEYVCTRDVVEAGWMPRQRQVGLTGRSIAPRLYIGIGVRGDFNHVVGIQRTHTIVAINNNKKASFFRGQCDVGVVADWEEFVPALVTELRSDEC